MEQLAEKYRGNFGPAAMPGLSETEFDADFGEATTAGLYDPTAIHPAMVSISANYVPDIPDATRTVDIGKRKAPQVRREQQWKHIFSHILLDETGEGITMMMRIDAIRFLSKVPGEITMPAVELGTEEITFEWRHGGLAATASVEGDGLVGYALKIGECFVPGKGPEDLSVKTLPTDLLDYLTGFPTE